MVEDTFTSRRLSRSLDRVERRIERKRDKLEDLRQRKDAGAMTRAKFSAKKSVIDSQLRELSARARTIKGLLRDARYNT